MTPSSLCLPRVYKIERPNAPYVVASEKEIFEYYSGAVRPKGAPTIVCARCGHESQQRTEAGAVKWLHYHECAGTEKVYAATRDGDCPPICSCTTAVSDKGRVRKCERLRFYVLAARVSMRHPDEKG